MYSIVQQQSPHFLKEIEARHFPHNAGTNEKLLPSYFPCCPHSSQGIEEEVGGGHGYRWLLHYTTAYDLEILLGLQMLITLISVAIKMWLR